MKIHRYSVSEQRIIEATPALRAKGLGVGLTSGLHYAAAFEIAKIYTSAVVVTILLDRMAKYWAG